jgi:hypothetical protein
VTSQQGSAPAPASTTAASADLSPSLAPGRRTAYDDVRGVASRHPLLTTGLAVLVVRLLTSITLPLAVAGRTSAIGGPTPFRFDGVYYLAIARTGYASQIPHTSSGKVAQSMLAFFPGYPLLLRWVHTIGLSWLATVVAVSTIAAVAAGMLVAAALTPWTGPRVAGLAAILWAAQPTAFVLSMAYSEGLFVAAAAACLVGLHRRSWVLAGLCAALASATRPSGIVLTLACAAAAVPAAVSSRRALPLVSVALAPLGMLGYFTYLAFHTGRFDAWFVTENDGWGAHTDFGYDTVHTLIRSVIHPFAKPAGIAVITAVVVSALLIVLLIRDHRFGKFRVPPEALVTGIGFAALAVSTSNVFSSIPRFFLPAFPLLAPLARRLSRLPDAALAALVLAATAVSVTIGAAVLVSSHYPM